MSYYNVQVALDKRLSLTPFATSLDIVFENIEYKPTKGQAYLRATNLTAESDQLDLANTVQSNVGIYQVDAFVPNNGRGLNDLLIIEDKIFQHFKSELKLDNLGTTVHIRNISRLPNVTQDAAWLIGGIQITYVSYF